MATSGISGIQSIRVLSTSYSISTRTVKSLIRTAIIAMSRGFSCDHMRPSIGSVFVFERNFLLRQIITGKSNIFDRA